MVVGNSSESWSLVKVGVDYLLCCCHILQSFKLIWINVVECVDGDFNLIVGKEPKNSFILGIELHFDVPEFPTSSFGNRLDFHVLVWGPCSDVVEIGCDNSSNSFSILEKIISIIGRIQLAFGKLFISVCGTGVRFQYLCNWNSTFLDCLILRKNIMYGFISVRRLWW